MFESGIVSPASETLRDRSLLNTSDLPRSRLGTDFETAAQK